MPQNAIVDALIKGDSEVAATVGRVLPHQIAPGVTNMALDEALLEDVAADPSFAYIRTYEWTVPTLSLGYFQNLADATAEPRFRGVPIVRRATGGGALWHDREITYSVIIPATHPFARQAQSFYRIVHEAIGQVIARRGLSIARRGEAAQPPENMVGNRRNSRNDKPFLCFRDRDSEDLVSQGIKLVGSAQRRRAGAVLQHGSVLLAKSRITPELPGLTDLLNVPEIEPILSWSAPIVQAIAEALGLTAQTMAVPDHVHRRTQELEFSIYSNPEWTERR